MKVKVHTLSVLIFSNIEHKTQGNIGVKIICSGHHHRDGFLHLHTGPSRAFSKPRKTEVSSGSIKHK